MEFNRHNRPFFLNFLSIYPCERLQRGKLQLETIKPCLLQWLELRARMTLEVLLETLGTVNSKTDTKKTMKSMSCLKTV